MKRQITSLTRLANPTTNAAPQSGARCPAAKTPLPVPAARAMCTSMSAFRHGIGNLVAADRDWRNPVAQNSIRRAQ